MGGTNNQICTESALRANDKKPNLRCLCVTNLSIGVSHNKELTLTVPVHENLDELFVVSELMFGQIEVEKHVQRLIGHGREDGADEAPAS